MASIITKTRIDDDPNYTVLDVIGQGSFGTCYKIKDKAGQEYCLKVVNEGPFVDTKHVMEHITKSLEDIENGEFNLDQVNELDSLVHTFFCEIRGRDSFNAYSDSFKRYFDQFKSVIILKLNDPSNDNNNTNFHRLKLYVEEVIQYYEKSLDAERTNIYLITYGLHKPNLFVHLVEYHCGESSERSFMILDLCKHMELTESFQYDDDSDRNVCILTKLEQLVILYGIALAIQALHSKNYIHRDLKPANILLDSKNRPKIGDLGDMSLKNTTNNPHGTNCFRAPETKIKDGEHYSITPKSDVFSFGATVFFLLTGKILFEEINPQEVDELYSECPTSPKDFDNALSNYIEDTLKELDIDVTDPFARLEYSLIKETLKAKPSDRITMDDAVSQLQEYISTLSSDEKDAISEYEKYALSPDYIPDE